MTPPNSIQQPLIDSKATLANAELPTSDVRPYGISRMQIGARDITKDEFGGLFKSYNQSAWRLELLTAYAVPNEDAEFKAFIEGAPLAPVTKEELAGDGAWCQLIRGHVAAGRTMGRVHILPDRLTQYLKYEIEWGYTFNNNAGDDIRLLPSASLTPELRQRLDTLQDFWLFDDSKVILCDYGPEGNFLGGREVTDTSAIELFISARKAFIEASLEFRPFMRAYRSGRIP